MVETGQLLWTPSPKAHRTRAAHRFPSLAGREARPDLPGFRGAVALVHRRTSTRSGRPAGTSSASRRRKPPTAVLGKRTMPGTEWFPGAELNYARHMLRHERPGATAVLHLQRAPGPAGAFLGGTGRQGAHRRHAAAQARREEGRPGLRLHGERPRGADRDAGDDQHRRDLVFGGPGLRHARRARPLLAARADGVHPRGRLPVRRQAVRPARRGREDPRAAHQREARDPAVAISTRRIRSASRPTRCSGTSCSTIRPCRARSSATRKWASTTRCGSCSLRAPPGCPSRSCTATAAS